MRIVSLPGLQGVGAIALGPDAAAAISLALCQCSHVSDWECEPRTCLLR